MHDLYVGQFVYCPGRDFEIHRVEHYDFDTFKVAGVIVDKQGRRLDLHQDQPPIVFPATIENRNNLNALYGEGAFAPPFSTEMFVVVHETGDVEKLSISRDEQTVSIGLGIASHVNYIKQPTINISLERAEELRKYLERILGGSNE